MSASAASEQLRSFCHSLLVLVDGETADPVLECASATLADVIREGSRQTAARLRAEIQTWEDASESLRRLDRTAFGDDAAALLGKLDRARMQALQVAETLDALPRLEGNRPEARASAPPRMRLEHGVFDSAPPSTRHRAAALFEAAEERRNDRDWEAAESLYCQALALDGDLREAYLHRGRIRSVLGRTDEAIPDLDRAVHLNGGDAIGHWWRGDAYAVAHRFEEALAAYSRALALRPDLFVVRYNRAVVLRKNGDTGQALGELDELIRLQPEHGPLYLNRGLIWLTRAETARAADDFRTALRLQPDSNEARQRADETEALLQVEIPPPPESEVTETPSIDDRPPIAEPPLSFAAETAPAPMAVPEANAPAPALANSKGEKSVSLDFECPSCGTLSKIRWDKLQAGKVLGCPKCEKRFTTKSSGRIVEVVKDANDRWIDAATKESQERTSRSKRYHQFSAAAAVAVLAFVMFWTPRIVSGLSHAEPNLPADLAPRSELFARAWLQGDLPTMRRLTDPVQERAVFLWSRRNPPPKTIDRAIDDIKVDVEVTQTKPTSASVRVRFEGINGSRNAPLELRLSWEHRGGAWLFQPTTIPKPRGGN